VFASATLLAGCLKSIGLGPQLELTLAGSSLTARSGEKLDYYIGRKPGAPPSDKIVVLIQGSGEGSVRDRFGDGAEAVTLGYDIVYLEKYAWNDPIAFRQTDSRTRRLGDVHAAIRYILDEVYGGSVKTVAIIAQGEGGVIAPDIAALIPETRWIVMFGESAASGSEKFKAQMRSDPAFPKVSGVATIEDLEKQLDRMRAKPSGDSNWLGHSWRYWSSYIDYSSGPSLERLDIPTMLIVGRRDNSVSADALASLRQRLAKHSNITVHVVAEADEAFNDTDGDSLLGSTIRNVVQPWYRDKVEPLLRAPSMDNR